MSSDQKQDDIRVLVTGASGFIAGHIIIQLLEAGYRVRGTVRDSKKSQAVLDLAKSVPAARYPIIELAEAELTNEKGWNDAVHDCMYVLHTASPFVVETPKDENILIKPAVEGTLRVLKAVAATHGKVKRVVLTSSVASICYGYAKETYKTKTFNETDWSIPEKCDPYPKSKVLAEKAAWDYLASLPLSEKFELTCINPSYVQGPVLNKKGCQSQELISQMMTGKLPALPPISFGIVDVRDVARAHILAMTHPKAAGQRYLCSSQVLTMREIAILVKQEYPQYWISTIQVPSILPKMVAPVDKSAAAIISELDIIYRHDNTKIQQELGLTLRPAHEAISAMATSLIKLGIVPDKTGKKIGPTHMQQSSSSIPLQFILPPILLLIVLKLLGFF